MAKVFKNYKQNLRDLADAYGDITDVLVDEAEDEENRHQLRKMREEALANPKRVPRKKPRVEHVRHKEDALNQWENENER